MTALCFLLTIFLVPLIAVVAQTVIVGEAQLHPAIAPALIMIGYLMIRLVADVDWSRPEAGIPAFLVIAGVPLTFSISAGIGFGVLGYVAVMVATGKAREVHPLMWALVPLFVAFFASDWLSAEHVLIEIAALMRPEFAAGATFADHIIRGVAGRGGMGVVYRALHVPLKREVALKVITPEASADESFRARFRRELEAAAAIQHPNVIPIHHAGEEDGLLFLTMRYVDGADLARVVAAQTRLEPVRAARLIAQVGAALDAAHASGVVHRDVKPANVMLEGEGEAEHALLTDFGLTKLLYSDTKVTQTGAVIGTFDYTAPEQLDEREVDARTDVYALGCVLFQALTGRVPYPRDRLAAKLFAHFEAPPPSVTALVPEAPAGLDAVINQALAKDPADRHQSAGDLARAALAAVDQPSLARGVSLLVAGESAPGWHWNTPAPRQRGVPLPAALTGELGGGPFVGRAEVLERLRARYAAAAQGRRQVVVLAGEPGIGKSRLAIEFARETHAHGATVLFGRSDPESLVPYQPFVSAVQHAMAHRDSVALPAELEPELSELARLVPALRRHLPELREPLADDPETRRYRLFEAVTRLLGFLAAERPIVLLLDDLQWVDASTALLLGHLLRDVEDTRLLVLGTFRDGDDHPLPGAARAAGPARPRGVVRADRARAGWTPRRPAT